MCRCVPGHRDALHSVPASRACVFALHHCHVSIGAAAGSGTGLQVCLYASTCIILCCLSTAETPTHSHSGSMYVWLHSKVLWLHFINLYHTCSRSSLVIKLLLLLLLPPAGSCWTLHPAAWSLACASCMQACHHRSPLPTANQPLHKPSLQPGTLIHSV